MRRTHGENFIEIEHWPSALPRDDERAAAGKQLADRRRGVPVADGSLQGTGRPERKNLVPIVSGAISSGPAWAT